MLFFLCVALAIPLVVHFHAIPVPTEVQAKFSYYTVDNDIFNWGKNIVLYVVGSVSILWLLLRRWKLDLYVWLMGAYLFLVNISALASKYDVIPWWGMPNYCEGAFAIACYGAIFVVAKELCKKPTAILWVNKTLMLVTASIFVLCAVEYFEPDLLNTVFFKGIIFGDPWTEVNVGSYKWPLFATLMNSNVLGTLAAITFGFFFGRRNWLFVFLSAAMAVGSQSRAAWLGMMAGGLYCVFNAALGSQHTARGVSISMACGRKAWSRN